MKKSTHIRFADYVEGRSDTHAEDSGSKSGAQALILAQENSSTLRPAKLTIPFFKTPHAGPISRTLENAHPTPPPLPENLKRLQKE